MSRRGFHVFLFCHNYAASSKSIREDLYRSFRLTCSFIIHPVPKNAICASMMSRCGTWAGGSIPEFPNCTVGGTRALGRINLAVVPPLAGILILSQTPSVTFVTLSGGSTSSDRSLYVAVEFRLSHPFRVNSFSRSGCFRLPLVILKKGPPSQLELILISLFNYNPVYGLGYNSLLELGHIT